MLSQAEHGVDSQVVLVAVRLTKEHLQDIEAEVDKQAKALSRVDIVRQSIARSIIVEASSLAEAIEFSNDYAPEHLILHLEDAPSVVASIDNAGSIFVGSFTPERYIIAVFFCKVEANLFSPVAVTTHLGQTTLYLRMAMPVSSVA